MSRLFAMATVAGCLVLGSCATAPETPSERQDLRADADQTLQEMKTRDPSLASVLGDSVGYVMFPEIGKGGFLVGGAYGRGIVYEQGVPIGYAELNQAELGALLGGESFSELIIFSEQRPLDRLKEGKYEVGAQASATALTSGAAKAARFQDGVAVMYMTRVGAMLDVSVSGQKINFQPFTAG